MQLSIASFKPIKFFLSAVSFQATISSYDEIMSRVVSHDPSTKIVLCVQNVQIVFPIGGYKISGAIAFL